MDHNISKKILNKAYVESNSLSYLISTNFSAVCVLKQKVQYKSQYKYI